MALMASSLYYKPKDRILYSVFIDAGHVFVYELFRDFPAIPKPAFLPEISRKTAITNNIWNHNGNKAVFIPSLL